MAQSSSSSGGGGTASAFCGSKGPDVPHELFGSRPQGRCIKLLRNVYFPDNAWEESKFSKPHVRWDESVGDGRAVARWL